MILVLLQGYSSFFSESKVTFSPFGHIQVSIAIDVNIDEKTSTTFVKLDTHKVRCLKTQ